MKEMGPIGRTFSRARGLAEVFRLLGCRAAFDVARDQLLGRQLMRIHVKGLVGPVFCRQHESHIPILLHLLGRHHADAPLGYEPRVIVDLGANIGLAALAFARRFPGARIISVEPAAENCDLFRRNTAGYRNIQLVQAAVWHRPAFVAIQNPDDKSDAFRVEEVPADAPGAMKTVTINELCAMGGEGRIDLLKVDIEGAERELFSRSAEGWLPLVRTVMVELHDQIKPGCREAVLAAASTRPHEIDRVGLHLVIRFGQPDFARSAVTPG